MLASHFLPYLLFAAFLIVSGSTVRIGDDDAVRTPWARPPSAGDLVINEVQPWPPTGETEYVELLNRSAHTLDITVVRMADARVFTSGADAASPIADTETLGPGKYLVLARDPDRLPDSVSPATTTVSWPALNNSGDSVVLLSEGRIIESVSYLSSQNEERASLERIDPSIPGDWSENWAPSFNGSLGSPGARNTRFRPDVTPPGVRSAEQTENTVITVRLDEPVAPESVSGMTATLGNVAAPENVTLSEDLQALFLHFTAGLPRESLQLSGLTDIAGNRSPTDTIEIAWIPQPGELVLNELLAEPLADPFDGLPDQPEYIELLSMSPDILGLRSCSITDRPNESGVYRSLDWPDGLHAMAPQGLAIVVADPAGATGTQVAPMLTEAFPAVFRDVPVYLIVLPRSSLSLYNHGQSLTLSCGGDTLESLHYTPEWHHPSLDETRGRSLERIDALGPADVSWNWSTSSAPEGGTPGAPNTLSQTRQMPIADPKVRVTPEVFSPNGDGVNDRVSILFRNHEDGTLVRALIFDLNGRIVRRLEEALYAGPEGAIVWDGRDDLGDVCAAGAYVVWMESQGVTSAEFKTVVVVSRPP